jgi:hypothetical protein
VRKGHSPSPAEVLGEENAHRLESHSPQGRRAAEVAAATAPGSAGTTQQSGNESGGAAAGIGGGGSGGGSGPGGERSGPAPTAGGHGQPAAPVGGADGSSGLGEILGQATGSSSGQMGLLFPLVILVTAAWALAFLWRQRDRRAS